MLRERNRGLRMSVSLFFLRETLLLELLSLEPGNTKREVHNGQRRR